MRWLTHDAVLCCDHELGLVGIAPTQSLVTIERRPVLVYRDPEDRTISGCPNVGPTIKPCLKTLKVKEGYSSLVRINGKQVCLDTITGFTDGTPPSTVNYTVRRPGQGFVGSDT